MRTEYEHQSQQQIQYNFNSCSIFEVPWVDFSVLMVMGWSTNSMPGFCWRGTGCKMYSSIYRQTCVDNNIIVNCCQIKQTLLLFLFHYHCPKWCFRLSKAEAISCSVFFSSCWDWNGLLAVQSLEWDQQTNKTKQTPQMLNMTSKLLISSHSVI